MKVGAEMALDLDDVESVLNEHKGILCEHGEEIQRLKLDSKVMQEKLSNIEGTLTRVENSVLSSNNTILQALTQVVTQTSNNRTQVDLKLIAIIGAFFAGLFAILKFTN